MTPEPLAPQAEESPYARAKAWAMRRANLTAKELGTALQLTPSVARSFVRIMEKDRVLAPANEAGRHLVLKEESDEADTVLAAALEGNSFSAMLAAFGPAIASDHKVTVVVDERLPPKLQGSLREVIAHINEIEDAHDEVKADRKEAYEQAKAKGYDTKILRKVVKILRDDRAKYQEGVDLIELYLTAATETEH